MFQAAMNPKERRNLGAHYTSEKNILKVIKPLFLDDLWAEFEKAKRSPKKLRELHKRIGELCFLDPACGSGNFLIITYRELRQLELEILRLLNKDGQMILDIRELLQVSINQFYGIEYEEFASKVAEVGMWLVEHQMNEVFSLEFGQNVINLPLEDSANIVHGNALRVDWEEVVSKEKLSYIIGNPPFIGQSLQSPDQKDELKLIFNNIKGSGILDYVCCWFYKASFFIQDTSIQVSFVSTNSITQGEQVSVLFGALIHDHNIFINFAHRTFNWSNKAKGNAAVHVIIIGFAAFSKDNKTIYDYDHIKGDPTKINVTRINPYLVEGGSVLIPKRSKPISDVPKVKRGNSAYDGGHLILHTKIEYEEFIKAEPAAAKYVKSLIGAREFLNNGSRWCLWLLNASPSDLKSLPFVLSRIKKVKEFRLNSKGQETKKYASTPSLFRDKNNPNSYIVIPRVSSVRRKYIPFGFFDGNSIVADSCLFAPDASIYDFGILSSLIHMSWVNCISGRLKSDYRYSKDIVYNNFPFPKNPSEKQTHKVESSAQAVLDTRANYPNSSLADLYDPLTMPPDLVKAHNALDKAVDQCYHKKPFANERERIEFLFELYEEYTAPLFEKK